MRDVKGGFEAIGISLGDTFLPVLGHAANGLKDVDKDGLPGVAKWLTTFAADMAFAPMIGALTAVSDAAGGKEATGSGLMGFLGQQAGFGQPGHFGGGTIDFGGAGGGAGGGASSMLTHSVLGPLSGMGPRPLGGGLGDPLTPTLSSAVSPAPPVGPTVAPEAPLPASIGGMGGHGMFGQGMGANRPQTQIGGVAAPSGSGSGLAASAACPWRRCPRRPAG